MLAEVSIPGRPELAAAARDLLEIRFAVTPHLAAEAGLLDDGLIIPSFRPEVVSALVARIDHDEATLRGLPWAELTADERIDVHWLLANVALLRSMLERERRWEHRPAEWLETTANSWVALLTYAPDRVDAQVQIARQLPAVVHEMKELVASPTRRDVLTGLEMVEGLAELVHQLPDSEERTQAGFAVAEYRAHLEGLMERTDLPEFRVIGKEAYEHRLKTELLLPWDADTLLRMGEDEIERVESRLIEIDPMLGEVSPVTAEEQQAANGLTRDGLLALYEDMVAHDLEATRKMGIITIPDDLPPMKARETPKTLIPFTGDGGSMSPVPLFGPETVGWWNVENFDPLWTEEQRLRIVRPMMRRFSTDFGPYAVHEGVPGHHLQLALFRANPDPIRTVFWDNPSVEGWGLYAEQLYWEHGGFGEKPDAEAAMLQSYLYRLRRIVYDVNVETGRWTLDEAEEWKDGPGSPEVDRDILRAIQWPTQLIGYSVGKWQIIALRDEAKLAWGDTYSERRFHDELIGVGALPLALARAKLLGLPLDPPSPHREYVGWHEPLPRALVDAMGDREVACPVGPDALSLVTVLHWTPTEQVAQGRLVIATEHADAMVRVFGRLYELHYPIASMRPISEFRDDDLASMAANNTSGFNCRRKTSDPSAWSEHAYGRAIDLNPLWNPFVRGEQVLPAEAMPWADRTKREPGMIHPDDEVVRAFAEVGWKWAGTWDRFQDYQHFSSTGQ